MMALARCRHLAAWMTASPFPNPFPRHLTSDSFQRLCIFKDADKGPKELEDDEYPKWLWTLTDPQPSKDHLYRKAQKLYTSGGYDSVFRSMEEKDLVRLFRLSAKSRIKANNSLRRGGRVL